MIGASLNHDQSPHPPQGDPAACDDLRRAFEAQSASDFGDFTHVSSTFCVAEIKRRRRPHIYHSHSSIKNAPQMGFQDT